MYFSLINSIAIKEKGLKQTSARISMVFAETQTIYQDLCEKWINFYVKTLPVTALYGINRGNIEFFYYIFFYSMHIHMFNVYIDNIGIVKLKATIIIIL